MCDLTDVSWGKGVLILNWSDNRFYFLSRSTKNFAKKYDLDLTAATFLIIDSNEASMEVILTQLFRDTHFTTLACTVVDRLWVAEMYRRHYQPSESIAVREEVIPG